MASVTLGSMLVEIMCGGSFEVDLEGGGGREEWLGGVEDLAARVGQCVMSAF